MPDENRTDPWSAQALQRLEKADELEITTVRADGSRRSWVPIWVVRVDDRVFVRTWQRRDTGWFGRVVRTGRARVRVAGLETDVGVTDLGPVGPADLALRTNIDAAYRVKYRRYGAATVDRMVGDEAAAATVELSPA